MKVNLCKVFASPTFIHSFNLDLLVDRILTISKHCNEFWTSKLSLFNDKISFIGSTLNMNVKKCCYRFVVCVD
jgi:hypothetical protein